MQQFLVTAYLRSHHHHGFFDFWWSNCILYLVAQDNPIRTSPQFVIIVLIVIQPTFRSISSISIHFHPFPSGWIITAMSDVEDWQIIRNPWESTKILHSQVRWSRWPSPARPPRWSPLPPWPTASTNTASSRRRGAADGWCRWQSSAHGCGASKAPTKGRTGGSLWGFHTAIAMENHKKFHRNWDFMDSIQFTQ